jgi:ADP-heptose:LPS heptosyltransferase
VPLKIDSDGVVGFQRMSLFAPSQANRDPSKRLTRIRDLLKNKRPKICIVRGEGIGDVLMTTPTLTAIQETFNHEVDIIYATNTRYLEGALVKVLKYNSDISAVIDRENIDEGDYDGVINLHCPCVAYEQRKNPPLNRVDIFARSAGVAPLKDTRIKYFLTREEMEAGRDFLHDKGITHLNKVVMVNIHSSSPWRGLDVSKTKQIVSDLYHQQGIISIIPSHDSDLTKDISWANTDGAIPVMNADIRKLAGILVHCNLLLCPDSAMLHLGGALNMPTVSVFMYTDPKARTNYFPNTVVVTEAKFSPCVCWTPAKCPINYACVRMINPDTITAACIKHINETKKLDLNHLPFAK